MTVGRAEVVLQVHDYEGLVSPRLPHARRALLLPVSVERHGHDLRGSGATAQVGRGHPVLLESTQSGLHPREGAGEAGVALEQLRDSP